MTFKINKARLAAAMQRVNLPSEFIIARFGKKFELNLNNGEATDEDALRQLSMILGVSEDYLVDTDDKREARRRFSLANSSIAEELDKVAARVISRDDKIALLNDVATLIGLKVIDVKAVTLTSLRMDKPDRPEPERKMVVS